MEYSDNQLEMSKEIKFAYSKGNFKFSTKIKNPQNPNKQQMYIMMQAQSISAIWQNSNVL